MCLEFDAESLMPTDAEWFKSIVIYGRHECAGVDRNNGEIGGNRFRLVHLDLRLVELSNIIHNVLIH